MKRLIPFLMLVLFSTTINAQDNYKNLWEQVHKFEIDNLPKSALKVVDNIYAQAERDKNSPQLIKCLFYKSKFSQTLEEDAQLKIVNQFKEHIAKSDFPTKQVLENVLANLYWQYFNQHRWQFYNRTKTENKVDKNDFRTWDLNTLFTEIQQYYNSSLAEKKQLQNIDIYQFADILHVVKGSKEVRPTLYDFLAHNALEFYRTDENNITKPAYQFKIDNPDLLSDAKAFSKLNLTTKDTLSLQFNALKIYQELTAFHLKNKNLKALVDIDLQRLDFVNQHATFNDKQARYLGVLEASQKRYKNDEASGLYAYEIAKIYNQKASSYQPKKNEENRFKNKEALAICERVIKEFPKSDGAKKCLILKNNITSQSLSLLTENYCPVNKHSRILVTYKNVDKLYFTAYKITKKQEEKLRRTHKEEEKIKFIQKLTSIKKWNNTLRNEYDYLGHTTEIIVPPLENNHYLIVASEKNDISTETVFGTATIQITDLVLIENNINGKKTYQVVNRNNGSPIKNAKIHLKNDNRNRRYNTPIDLTLTTNKNGFASYKSKNNHNGVVATVSTKTDKATFGDYYINIYEKPNKYDSDEDEYIEIKPFVFTDRSIYRPGQTAYFKTIFLKKKGDKSSPFTNEFIKVTLSDPNGQTAGEIDIKLNEYGSASGEFILPNNGLTGEYSFDFEGSDKTSKFYDNDDIDYELNYYSNHRISVEEYKRPKFETEFKPVTETFKLNDSVTVNGFAKAFSGANITEAKVVYRVHRKVQYPRWWYWYRPSFSSEPQEIKNGESVTDASGNFTIDFIALADESVDKNSLPIFSYEITADVTDVNGETRSATTIVKVGYHALTANISVPQKVDVTEKNQVITIDTKNLNDEFVSAKGVLKIYKLQAPSKPLRKRPWQAPDYQDISENEFRELFPNDPYAQEENDEKNWKKGALVFETDFDTEKSKEIKLRRINDWSLGKYIVVLETKDKFGQEVKDEAKFTLINSHKNVISDSELFFIRTDKSVYKTGEDVSLNIGTASKNMTVVILIEKNHEIVKTKLVHLNNEVKTLSIPVKRNDIGGFAIKYYYVNFNQFDGGSLVVEVPQQQENIVIETKTFRDKLQPGEKQTWSFKIKNDNNDKVTAEVLASMYDASLDEFKNHSWYFDPIQYEGYYSYGYNANAYQSFGSENFRIFNIKYVGGYVRPQEYDRLNWFGFNFNNNRWKQRQYVNKLKRQQERTKKVFDGIVSGVVEDENGPLPGVSITIKGTNFGTETDFDGKYSIKVSTGDVLVYSYLGYKTLESTVGSSYEKHIKLEEDGNVLDEVVVVGYGETSRKAYTGSVLMAKSAPIAYSALKGEVAGLEISEADGSPGANSNVRIRGSASISGDKKPLYVIDGVVVDSFDVNANEIITSTILKGTEATSLYGAKASNGVVIITTKKGQAKLQKELSKVQARKNLQETAFFFPHLTTDKKGNVSFNFTIPEALTRWKLQLLAHTKELHSATQTLQTVTQKELMVVPNAPRFLRQGDTIVFSAKISNLSNKNLQGLAQLVLTDAVTGKEVNLFSSSEVERSRSFNVDKNGNTNVSWTLAIPDNIDAVQYKVVAKAGDFSDGEQNALPVLTNRMLVTETLPLWVRSNQTKTFSLDKLKNNNSTTLKNHKLTLEVTSNPAWYAVQALPYLMEYPYECSEQTFARYYANTLASHIANSNPRIQEVFNAWKSSDALLSNLEKNQELKSLIIQETPWLRDAQSETEQKKRIALLFDLNKMSNEQSRAINKLVDMQMSNGGFPWFKGGRYPNAYITNYIASGFGHLQQLGVKKFDDKTDKMLKKAVRFLDKEFEERYEKLLERAEKTKDIKGKDAYEDFLKSKHIRYFEMQYLYMRSFYTDIKIPSKTKKAVDYYTKQSATYWNDFNLYGKGLIALIQYRTGDKTISTKILNSLRENSITSEELGMYWKENTASWYWYQAPIETQALLIEAFSEIENDVKTIDELKVWLLKNKQVSQWKTTKATSEAVYALLLQGSDWISTTELVDIELGNIKIDPTKMPEVQVEAGTGYFKTSWNGNEVTPEMGDVTIASKGKTIAWGGLYWQYFEDLDKITSAETPLKLKKKLFKKVNSDTGKELIEVTDKSTLKVGDLLTVRIELRSDRDMEFIHMKDMRASGVEPINVLSRYKWQDGLGYYESTKDASTNFFFDRLPKGVYVFEYDVRVNNAGDFSNGITTIESMYAPEFKSHSEGVRISVE